MSGIIFMEPGFLWLLALIAPAWMLFRDSAGKRREAMRLFGGLHPLKAGEQALLQRRGQWMMFCYCAAFAVLALAMARPAWKQVPVEAGSRGRDVLFLLDVSNSMLAEDIAPNRLERAKQAIADCVGSLEGDRVGLVIFAGSPSIVCPLTTDYGFFRSMLEEAGPGNVSQGGTRIGDAIRKTHDKLLDESRKGYQDLILITDGGDQESQPEAAAVELEALGVFLVVVGLGDERRGERIPLPGADKAEAQAAGARQYLSYQGKPVWSRLESAPLERMAKASRNGVYLNAGTRAFDLGEVYGRLVDHFESRGTETSETTLRYRDEFQWFLVAALIALCLPHLAGARAARRFNERRTAARGAAAAIALAGVLLPAAAARAQEADNEVRADRPAIEHYNEGCRLLGLHLYSEAAEVFRLALAGAGDSQLRVRACYNLGNSYYRGGEAIMAQDKAMALEFFAMSALAFRGVLDYQEQHADAAWNLELARRREKELLDALRSEREGDDAEAAEDEGEKEGEDGEEGEKGDKEDAQDMEESEESSEGKPSDYSASDLALDLQSEGLPPPMVDPEDIFEEETANNELRQKKGAKYQAVEKDW